MKDEGAWYFQNLMIVVMKNLYQFVRIRIFKKLFHDKEYCQSQKNRENTYLSGRRRIASSWTLSQHYQAHLVQDRRIPSVVLHTSVNLRTAHHRRPNGTHRVTSTRNRTKILEVFRSEFRGSWFAWFSQPCRWRILIHDLSPADWTDAHGLLLSLIQPSWIVEGEVSRFKSYFGGSDNVFGFSHFVVMLFLL